MGMPVVRVDGRNGDDSDFIMLNLAEVNYIKLYKPRNSKFRIPLYYTGNASYAPVLTLTDISSALHYRGFSLVDKSTIINNNRLTDKRQDRYGITLYFIDRTELNVSSRSKYL